MRQIWPPDDCSCAECSAKRDRLARSLAEIDRVQLVMQAIQPEPEPELVRPDDLHEALQALVAVVDRIGGYMSPGDQAVLWRARTLSGGAR